MAKGTGVRPNYNKEGVVVSWKVDVSFNGNRHTATCTTEDEANAKYNDLKEKLVYGQPIDLKKKKEWTTQDAKDYIWEHEWKNTKSKKTTLINVTSVLDFFGSHRLLSDIDDDLIDEFIDYLKSTGLSNSTINRKLSCLSKLFTYAMRKRRLDTKPYIPFFKKAKSRKRFISPEEEKLHLDIAIRWGMHDVHDFSIYLVDGGARPWTEAIKTRKQDVNFTMNTISLWQTKQDTPRTIFMTKRLREVMERRVALTQDKTSPLFDFKQTYYSDNFNRIKGQMGLENDKQFIPYTWRHTCCSRLAMQNLNLVKIKDWMGHKSILTTMEYAHLNTADLIDCAKALENF